MGFLTPNATGEHDVLCTYALQQLAQMRTTIHGLTDEQIHTTPTASALNLSALVMHAGAVAVYWSACAASAPDGPALPDDFADDPSLDRLIADDRPIEAVLEFFDRCVAITTENLEAATDLDALAPVPVAPWFPDDLTHWQARWCLAHISTEIARHVGHADIIRETLDGATSFELNDSEERAE